MLWLLSANFKLGLVSRITFFSFDSNFFKSCLAIPKYSFLSSVNQTNEVYAIQKIYLNNASYFLASTKRSKHSHPSYILLKTNNKKIAKIKPDGPALFK